MFEGIRESDDNLVQKVEVVDKNTCSVDIEKYGFTFVRNRENLLISSTANYGGGMAGLNDIPKVLVERAKDAAKAAFDEYDSENKEARKEILNDASDAEFMHEYGEEALDQKKDEENELK